MQSISTNNLCMGMKSGGQATLLAPLLEKVRGQLPPLPRSSAVYALVCLCENPSPHYYHSHCVMATTEATARAGLRCL